jgi:hypothetical protein
MPCTVSEGWNSSRDGDVARPGVSARRLTLRITMVTILTIYGKGRQAARGSGSSHGGRSAPAAVCSHRKKSPMETRRLTLMIRTPLRSALKEAEPQAGGDRAVIRRHPVRVGRTKGRGRRGRSGESNARPTTRPERVPPG